MALEFWVISRTNDPDLLVWGREGPRLYATERNAVKQAKHHNANDAKWGEKHPDVPHLQEYKKHGPWFVRKVSF